MKPRTFFHAATALAITLIARPAVADEYRLGIGDTLAFNVTGIVGLERRMTIGLGGKISVPLVGELKAEGATVSDLLAQIRAVLPTKTYTLRPTDGRETITVIASDEILLSVAEYRPIYVKGDVAKPGEQGFRAGMTVRQAIALAGGYDVLRFRIENPVFTTYDLLAEYRSLWLDRARYVARVEWNSKALGHKPDLPVEPVGRDLLSDRSRASAAHAEIDLLEAKKVTYERSREAAQGLVKAIGDEIKTLERQLKTEEENAKFDAEESERIGDLFRRGTVPATRLSEVRRLMLLSATRVLQVAAQLEASRRGLLNAQRELRRSEDDRRTELATGLQETGAELRRLSPRIDAVWDKLRYVTALRSQLAEGGSGGERQLSLVRRGTDGSFTVAASEDDPLRPGDVVEVRMTVDFDAGTVSQMQ